MLFPRYVVSSLVRKLNGFQESMRLLFMVRAYQVNGHMKAKLDPLKTAMIKQSYQDGNDKTKTVFWDNRICRLYIPNFHILL
jgi:hypothetical protein